MTIELAVQTPDGQSRRRRLEGERLALGRAHTNELSFPEDASLSRRHLVFERDGAGWLVRDLGSKNGTLVNGKRLADAVPLGAGDRISAGQLIITAVDPDQAPVDERVQFVPGSGPELAPGATVMTSLEGVLSGEATVPLVQPALPGVLQGRAAFNLPIVRVLIRAGRELAQNRPLDELFALILELSIEAVGGQRGVLMTLEQDRLVPRAFHGEGFRISTTVRDRVVREKASLLVRDIEQEEKLRKQESIFQQRIHSLMAVPLQTEDKVIGLIYVDSSLFAREFTPDDLNLLTVLANVAANRIEQERYREVARQNELSQRDLEQAAEIQRGILPRRAPEIAGLDVAGYNASCRTVGGDYYDFIPFADGRLMFVVADVAGKGMSAAMLMSNLQARVQLLAQEDLGDLAALMGRLDKSLALHCPSNRFITLFCGVIDPRGGRLLYCNAGHNPPLLVRASGEVRALTAVGTVLGVLPDLGYQQESESLAAGDLIAVYSDGVTEAVDPSDEEFGPERLAEVLVANRNQPAEEIIAAVHRVLAVFSAGAPPADDVTLVVVRRIA